MLSTALKIEDMSATKFIREIYAMIHELSISVIGLSHTSTLSLNRLIFIPVFDFLSFSLQTSFETSPTLMGLKLNDGPELLSSIALILR